MVKHLEGGIDRQTLVDFQPKGDPSGPTDSITEILSVGPEGWPAVRTAQGIFSLEPANKALWQEADLSNGTFGPAYPLLDLADSISLRHTITPLEETSSQDGAKGLSSFIQPTLAGKYEKPGEAGGKAFSSNVTDSTKLLRAARQRAAKAQTVTTDASEVAELGFVNSTATTAMSLAPGQDSLIDVYLRTLGQGDPYTTLQRYANQDARMRENLRALDEHDATFVDEIEGLLLEQVETETWSLDLPRDQFTEANLGKASINDALEAIGHNLNRQIKLVNEADDLLSFEISPSPLTPLDNLLKGTRAIYALQQAGSDGLLITKLAEKIGIAPDNLSTFLDSIRGTTNYFDVKQTRTYLRRQQSKTEEIGPTGRKRQRLPRRPVQIDSDVPYGYTKSKPAGRRIAHPQQTRNFEVLSAHVERLEKLSQRKVTDGPEEKAQLQEILLQNLSRGEVDPAPEPTFHHEWELDEIEAVLDRIILERTVKHADENPPLKFDRVNYQLRVDGNSEITLQNGRVIVIEDEARIGKVAAIIMGKVTRTNQTTTGNILMGTRDLRIAELDEALEALEVAGIGSEELRRVGNTLLWTDLRGPEIARAHVEEGDIHTLRESGTVTELAESGEFKLVQHVDDYKLLKGHRIVRVNGREADVIKTLMDTSHAGVIRQTLYKKSQMKTDQAFNSFMFEMREKTGLLEHIVSDGGGSTRASVYYFIDPQNPPILAQARNVDGEVFLQMSIDRQGHYITKWGDDTKRVHLGPSPADLLRPLMISAEQRVPKRDLLEKLWLGEFKDTGNPGQSEFSDYALLDDLRRLREADPDLKDMILTDLQGDLRLIDKRKPPLIKQVGKLELRVDQDGYHLVIGDEAVAFENYLISTLQHFMGRPKQPVSHQEVGRVSGRNKDGGIHSLMSDLRRDHIVSKFFAHDGNTHRFIDPTDPLAVLSTPQMDIFLDGRGFFLTLKDEETGKAKGDRIYLDAEGMPKLTSPTSFPKLLKAWTAKPYYPYNGHELLMDAGISRQKPIPWGTTLEEHGVNTSKPSSTLVGLYQHLLDMGLKDRFPRKQNTFVYTPDPGATPIAWSNDTVVIEKPDRSFVVSDRDANKIEIIGKEARIVASINSDSGKPVSKREIADAAVINLNDVDLQIAPLRATKLGKFIFETDEGFLLMEPSRLRLTAEKNGIELYSHHEQYGYLPLSPTNGIHLSRREVRLLRAIMEAEGRIAKARIQEKAHYKRLSEVDAALNRLEEKQLYHLFKDWGASVEFIGLDKIN
ncbi:MAG: helix-turn-helix domain-containing protein [Vampirovibrio sp.]|nr:helix-turn-helix domain-containing protein [Vampirovibrio sp.]